MTDQHPITPPPELMHQWHKEACKDLYKCGTLFESKTLKHIATAAAQWGADQELEACCEWLFKYQYDGEVPLLRAARRPKLPSLKEQALAALQEAAYMADDAPPQGICSDQIDIIRKALEQLND